MTFFVDHRDIWVIFPLYMTTLLNLTADQLRKAISIKEQIEALEAQLAGLGGDVGPGVPISAEGRGTYKRSAAAGTAMAAAQKRRWAKLKRATDEGRTVKRQENERCRAGEDCLRCKSAMGES